jgi:trehalose-6-phosphatase
MQVSVRMGRVELSLRSASKGRLVAALLDDAAAAAAGGASRALGSSSQGAAATASAAATTASGDGSSDAGSAESGTAVAHGGGSSTFVLTAGDDVTDEEMFSVSRAWAQAEPTPDMRHAVGVLVGSPHPPASSAADVSLPTVADFHSLLIALYEASQKPP